MHKVFIYTVYIHFIYNFFCEWVCLGPFSCLQRFFCFCMLTRIHLYLYVSKRQAGKLPGNTGEEVESHSVFLHTVLIPHFSTPFLLLSCHYLTLVMCYIHVTHLLLMALQNLYPISKNSVRNKLPFTVSTHSSLHNSTGASWHCYNINYKSVRYNKH